MDDLKFTPQQLKARLALLDPVPRRFFIGLSGGLDSVVLLHAMMQEAEVTLLHVHHHLQPQADAWQSFVEELAVRYALPLHIHHLTNSPLPGESVEAFAREGRYAFFESCLRHETDYLLLAHHLDDQVETFFLNLKRGSGLKGLTAMPACRFLGRGFLFRPLLDVRRTDLEAYAAFHHLNYVTDPSNADSRFDRNYLRNEVLPTLKARWPEFDLKVKDAISHLHDANQALSYYLEQDLLKLCHPREVGNPTLRLTTTPPFLHAILLQSWFKKITGLILSEAHLTTILRDFLDAKPGAEPLFALQGWTLRIYRDHFYLMPAVSPVKPYARTCTNADIAAFQAEGLDVSVIDWQRATLRSRPSNIRCKPRGRAHSQTLNRCFQEAGVPSWVRDHLAYLFEGEDLKMVVGAFVCD